MADGGVKHVAVTSTVGCRLRLLSPWQQTTVARNGTPEALTVDDRGIATLGTRPDGQLVFEPGTKNADGDGGSVSSDFLTRMLAENLGGSFGKDADGNIFKATFVFVTLPRGYWSEEFYSPLETAIHEGGVDFELDRVEQPDRFAFAFLADMHLERREIGVPKFDATLAELNNKAPKVSFLLFQGDICLQAGSGDIYVDCLQAAEMPVRHGAGNHEMVLEHDNPRDEFERRFGPTYYSFDWGPLHCIVLDGNKPIPGQSGWQAVQ